jgi:hypothetical protein
MTAKRAEMMDLDTCEFYLALAQVHATLALAAATALPPANYPGSARLREWIDTVEPAAVTS